MAKATASRDRADEISSSEKHASTEWKAALRDVFGVWRDHDEVDRLTQEERRKLAERLSAADRA